MPGVTDADDLFPSADRPRDEDQTSLQTAEMRFFRAWRGSDSPQFCQLAGDLDALTQKVRAKLSAGQDFPLLADTARALIDLAERYGKDSP